MKKIKLSHPVEAEGRPISELTMRRPKVRDERDARRAAGSDDAGERELALFGNLCGEPPEVMEELDLADYRRLQETFAGFFGGKSPPAP